VSAPPEHTNQHAVEMERDAPIETWFHIGGRAKRLARPRTEDELRACLAIDPDLVVVGEGANLLVLDGGVDALVVSLQTEGFRSIEIDRSLGRVVAGAGVSLPPLISRTVKEGLGGLEVLAGIPASVGGAAVMNAGGRYGCIADRVESVRVMTRSGEIETIGRDAIGFGYRRSGLDRVIVLGVTLALEPGDPGELKDRLAECMRYKTGSQPMRDKSAGCAFKNPELARAIEGIGDAGERAPAGMLIDRAGCKGLAVGGARVSDRHANFIVTEPGALAKDVAKLMDEVARRVEQTFGVVLEREVVVWGTP